ncbi:MAG: Ig-like domain-containing protein, partial [Bacteroidales bacterium]|nr:Ig-like domain-containing protein [Bacteroidales bacterium]
KKKDTKTQKGVLQLSTAHIGSVTLSLNEKKTGAPVNEHIIIEFNSPLDTSSVKSNIVIRHNENNASIGFQTKFEDNYKTLVVIPDQPLDFLTDYVLHILPGIKGADGESFTGVEYRFSTINGELVIESVTINDQNIRKVIAITRCRFLKY